jgi:23S rRNA-/tRNA-specific pseudouridylate synthase
MAVLRGGAGRSAHTIFEVEDRYSEFTLVKAVIKTGRTHQIRVHLAHIGHPVAGDTTYGGGRENTVRDSYVKQQIRALGRHFLHAAQLGFTHPRTDERMEFSSPLPPELTGFLAGIKG